MTALRVALKTFVASQDQENMENAMNIEDAD